MQNDRTSRSQPMRAKQRFCTNVGASAPVAAISSRCHSPTLLTPRNRVRPASRSFAIAARSEEHTSELQSQSNLVCRLLLEKKNNHKRQCYRYIDQRRLE